MEKKEIKLKAEGIIERFSLPIPFKIGELVKDMGLELEVCKPEKIIELAKQNQDITDTENINPDEVLGYMDQANRKIYITKGQNINRLRFSIAHEIGHSELHKDNHFRKIFTRKDIFSSEPSEVDANYFAGYLLMPDKEIEKLLPLTKILTGTDIVSQFSHIFGVSEEAMRIRLKTFKRDNIAEWEKYPIHSKLFD